MTTQPMHLDPVSVAEAIDAAVEGGSYTLPAATATVLGGVKEGAAVAPATDATDVITQLNALLTSLEAAGVIASA